METQMYTQHEDLLNGKHVGKFKIALHFLFLTTLKNNGLI